MDLQLTTKKPSSAAAAPGWARRSRGNWRARDVTWQSAREPKRGYARPPMKLPTKPVARSFRSWWTHSMENRSKRLSGRRRKSLGGIHILANCAARVGGTIPDSMETISDEQIVKDFEEKFLGYYRCAREAAPYMKQAGWGRIVNLSGGAGRTPGTGISTPARNIACVALTQVIGQYAWSLRNQRQCDLSRLDDDRSGLGAEP